MSLCVEVVPRWLGETEGFWVQTGALLISAIAAILTIAFSARSERRRATVELALHQENNPKLVEAQEFVLQTRKIGDYSFISFLDKRGSDEFQKIVKVLNNYEFIAAAIQQGALDEAMYKKVWYTRFIGDWGVLCGFVTELRSRDKQPTLCKEYEALVTKWLKKGHA